MRQSATAVWSIVAALILLPACGTREGGAGDGPRFDHLSAMLSGEDEVNAIMGSTDIREDITFTRLWHLPDGRSYDPAPCMAVAGNTMEPVYRDSGYQEVRETLFADPAESLDISQAVVTFPSPAQARALVAHTVDIWRDCADKTLTITFDDDPRPRRHTVARPERVGDVEVTSSASHSSFGWGNWRAIRAVDGMVVDVRISGRNITADQAVRLVEAVANRNTL